MSPDISLEKSSPGESLLFSFNDNKSSILIPLDEQQDAFLLLCCLQSFYVLGNFFNLFPVDFQNDISAQDTLLLQLLIQVLHR